MVSQEVRLEEVEAGVVVGVGVAVTTITVGMGVLVAIPGVEVAGVSEGADS